jgi:hypothetical protein
MHYKLHHISYTEHDTRLRYSTVCCTRLVDGNEITFNGLPSVTLVTVELSAAHPFAPCHVGQHTQRQTAQCAYCLSTVSPLLVFLLQKFRSFWDECEISSSAFTFAHTSVWCWDFVTSTLRPSGYLTCHRIWHREILRSAHTVHFSNQYGPQNKYRLCAYTAWTEWLFITETCCVHCEARN